MRHLLDTIVAPITGSHMAAVAVVRVSGPKAWKVARHVFAPWPDSPSPRMALFGHFANGDDGLAIPFAEGHSYSGDETVEFSVHGSPASVKGIIDACIQAGARPARPGEFTMRAFMFGRIDLTQAEGVRDTVAALTDAQLRQANLLREGALHDAVHALRDDLLGLLAAVEASTDFPEEVGPLDRDGSAERCRDAARRLGDMLSTAETGRILRGGLAIAIVGLPNAGKSSLLNALLGAERAIVTEIPGTTRDTVEELANLGGIPCRLIDTAGLGAPLDPIERIGVDRAKQAAANADLVWYVYDASLGWSALDEALAMESSRPTLVLANKADLGPVCGPGLPISALTGQGIDELVAAVHDRIGDWTEAEPLVNERHAPLLQVAREALLDVVATLESSAPDDLAAVGLMQAARALGEVTGETASPDAIERLFSTFCVGK